MVLKPLDVAEVRGVQFLCGETKINDIFGCTFQN